MKMFPRLAIVILFTLLSIQQTRSECFPLLKKGYQAVKSVFQDTLDHITYEEYKSYSELKHKKFFDKRPSNTWTILVGEFYSNEIEEVGSKDDHAKCTPMKTPEQWPKNYLPSVRFCDSAVNFDAICKGPTMDKDRLETDFDYKKEIWECYTERGTEILKFNMVVNRLENKLGHLTVDEVKYMSGVEVTKKKIGNKIVAKIKEVKFFNPKTHDLVKYAGYVKLIESETNNP